VDPDELLDELVEGLLAELGDRTLVVVEDPPRLFDPPPPVERRPAAPAAEDLVEPTSEQPQPELLDAPLQMVEAADETLFRCTTVKEDRLLSGLFPRPGCTLARAQSLYAAFATIYMREKGRPLRPSDWLEVSRAELAREVGVRSQRALGPYLDALREGGLLERRRRRRGANLWRLPHYRAAESRKATDSLSSDQGRQSTANPSRSRKAIDCQPLTENDTRENNVVRLSPNDERRARQAQRLAAGERAALERSADQEASL
jgi:DNA-binding transcriptional ArsR family regulator